MPRATPHARGYGAKWRKRRAAYLAEHPTCSLCPGPSQVPDHFPRSRKELLDQGVDDPDLPCFLRPLCERCHNRETATRQPGGWNVKGKRQRDKPRHPGLID